MRLSLRYRLGRQRGAAAIEFALVAGVGGFLVLLIGIMELGRVLFYLNTASEVTRLGARIAVVCDISATTTATIVARMSDMLTPLKTGDYVSLDYSPAGCAAQSNCQFVTVGIKSGLTVNTFIPYVPISVSLPPFSTTLPRESLKSTDNSLCF